MKKFIAIIVSISAIFVAINANATAFCIMAICYMILGVCAYHRIANEDTFVKGICVAAYMFPAIALLLRTTPGGTWYHIFNGIALLAVVVMSWLIAVASSSKKSDS